MVDRLSPLLLELDSGDKRNAEGVDGGGQAGPAGWHQESRRLAGLLPGGNRRVLPDRARLAEQSQQQDMTVEEVARRGRRRAGDETPAATSL